MGSIVEVRAAAVADAGRFGGTDAVVVASVLTLPLERRWELGSHLADLRAQRAGRVQPVAALPRKPSEAKQLLDLAKKARPDNHAVFYSYFDNRHEECCMAFRYSWRRAASSEPCLRRCRAGALRRRWRR